jgi:hypothetical protein
MNAHPIWVVNDFSLRAVAHKLSERRVLTLPLRIVVLNAELSAERRDGNGNNSAHCINCSTRWRTPYLATQPWMGILSKWFAGTGPFDLARVPVNGPYLTGVMASRSGGTSTAKVGTELLWFRSGLAGQWVELPNHRLKKRWTDLLRLFPALCPAVIRLRW